MCLAQGHNTATPVRLEPAANRSRVKHSTTEQLRSLPHSRNPGSAPDALSSQSTFFQLCHMDSTGPKAQGLNIVSPVRLEQVNP